MYVAASTIALIALLYVIWLIVSSPFLANRKRKSRGVLGAVVFLVAAILASNAAQKAARDEGFDDWSDKTTAQSAGVTDADAWKAQKAEQRRLAEMQAERERAAQEERQQLEAARLAEEERQESARLAEEKRQKEADAVVCLTKLDCIWNSQEAYIAAECRRAIQALAKWDYEWIDGMFEPAFEPAGWAKHEDGTIMVAGGKLKLQNGFGAWKRVNYLCAYDPKTKTAIEARVLAD